MVSLLAASFTIFLVLAGWVWVQQVYARFAARHPELGPFRTEEGGCACAAVHCDRPGATARQVPAPRFRAQAAATPPQHPSRRGLPMASGSKEHVRND